jgi:CHAD domain-containing protein/uncharacterized protein YjbK
MDQQEIEWQFSVDDVRRVANCLTDHASALGVTVQVEAMDNIHDVYFDTADWRIYRANYALRVRNTDGRLEATLKSLKSIGKGARQRREITEDLPASTSPMCVDTALAGLVQANGPVGQLVRRVVGKQPIQSLFELLTKRDTVRVQTDNDTVGLVALDETEILVDDRCAVRLNRVEVEVKQGVPDDLEPFVTRFRDLCGMQPARWSKYQMGLAAKGVTPGAAIVAGPTEVKPSVSIGDLALVTLRRHFNELLAQEPAAKLGEDAKPIHQMRVATRRLRSALTLFRSYLPSQAAILNEELRWVASALGAIRDLDIQIGHIGHVDKWSVTALDQDRNAVDALKQVLAQLRASAHAELLAVFNDMRYEALLESFGALLQGPAVQVGHTSQPALEVAPKLVVRCYRKTRKLGDALDDSSSLDEYHALRKQFKRLRYAVEAVSPLYDKRIKTFVRQIETVQELLGELQDASASMRRLHELCVTHGSLLTPLTVYIMGAMAERNQQQALTLISRFPQSYRRVTGKAWAQCRHVMQVTTKRN